MSTYKRLGNIFYKIDGENLKQIKFTNDYVLIEVPESVDENAAEIKEEDYIAAVCAVTKFGCVGGHPDIPPQS